MVIVVVLGLAFAGVMWLRRRAKRKQLLAGLDAGRPVFSVEPPHRRHSSLDRESL